MKLQSGEVYFSPLDLNVEHGEIEDPYVPTIRVAVPVHNSRARPKGILIVNRNVGEILSMLKTDTKTDRLMLTNLKGDWLLGMKPEQDWGFMFGRTDTFSVTFREVWSKVLSQSWGTYESPHGIWVWSTISPYRFSNMGSEAAMPMNTGYKLISLIDRQSLLAIGQEEWKTLLPYFAVGAVLFWFLLVRLMDTRIKTMDALAKLHESERLRRVEARADEAEMQAQSLIESNVNGMLTIDAHGHIVMANPALEALFGYDQDELLGQPLEILVPDAVHTDHSKIRAHFVEKPKQQRMRDGLPVMGKHKNGHEIPVEVSLSPVAGIDGMKVTATVFDISKRLEADKSMRQMASVFENTGDGIVITDAVSRIINVNRAFEEITGYTLDEVRGKFPSFYHSGRHTAEFYRDMERKVLENGHWRGEHSGRRKDGKIYSEWLTVSRVTNGGGEISNFVHVFADISRIKDSQKQLDRLTYQDTLTSLPNRRLFMQRLEHALAQAKRRSKSLAVIVLDLDNFKHINDGLGHAAGDELLQSVANMLTSTLRDEDTVARLGGDEFVVLLEEIASPESATSLAGKLINQLDTPLTIHDQEVRVTSSMGICFYPQDGEDSDTLMRNADAAMYRAKEDGRNCYHFYTEALTERSVERLNMEKSLRQSLENNDFYMVYQPQVELKSGNLIGVEALVRWEHPEMGMISPVRFIPLAEESGLIYKLERWIFHESCRQARAWLDQGVKFGRMAINLSGKSIHAGDVPKIISQVLLETRCPANVIELEVSEGFIMQRAVAAIEQLNELRQMGIALSIDDFGTGYSSLSYLKQLPIDKLKIDQAFVRDVTVDENDRAIVSAVIAMGKKLNMTVIAEGVETRAQARFLLDEGCEEAQGYLFSKPIRPDDLESLQAQLLQNSNGGSSKVVIFPTKDAE